MQDIFRVKSMFIGANVREATNDGRADYVPVFLSETPLLFRRGIVNLDAAFVQVSKKNVHFCTCVCIVCVCVFVSMCLCVYVVCVYVVCVYVGACVFPQNLIV